MSKNTVFNFAPGPALLPGEVMEKVREELLDWHGTGMSVMEMSHRGKEFLSIAEEAEADLREILNVPASYKVLYVPGGATMMMSMVPLNLLAGGETGDYVVTGNWSKKSYKEAIRLGRINLAATSESDNFYSIPPRGEWKLSDKPPYVYICDNETIAGVEYHDTPDVGDIPLVSDMTSNFLSRPFDVTRYGIAFASAQKNFGPAGMACVLVREDLIGRAGSSTPFMLDLKTYAENESMFNTPPTFNWYFAGMVYKWVREQGGVEAMDRRARERAGRLYDAIDGSDFYSNPIRPAFRSRMNVPFILRDDALNATFLSEAKQHGLLELKGHRSVGGMRASIYNGMPMAGVEALVSFMQDFENRHG